MGVCLMWQTKSTYGGMILFINTEIGEKNHKVKSQDNCQFPEAVTKRYQEDPKFLQRMGSSLS